MDYYGTIGPSCEDTKILEKLFRAGMTGVRINLSHKTIDECECYIKNIKEASKNCGVKEKILIDIQGPELRIGDLTKPLELKSQDYIHLGTNGIPVPKIIFSYLKENQEILLDDSLILLQVISFNNNSAECKILRGGVLDSRKSISLSGVDIDNETLTSEDYDSIFKINQYGITGIMLPFVRNRHDLITLKSALKDANANQTTIHAKIENQDGINNLESFLDLTDEVIIARGDLGNSLGLYSLLKAQKNISNLCNKHNKNFMVVTQLLHSMLNSSVPTRAEISDIFNATLDGASSLMLTGETAIGKYPIEAMTYLVNTSKEALKYKHELLHND